MPPRSHLHPYATIRLTTALVVFGGLLLLVTGCKGRGDCAEASTAEAMLPANCIAVSHVLVAFDGALDQTNGVARTRDEALERARRIAVLLRTGRGDLDRMARRFSDDPTAERNGGYLGIFGKGEMNPSLEDAVSALDIGEVGGPIETQLGFHVVRREEVRRLNIHHVLVSHRDAVLASDAVHRDREEAARVADALHHKLIRHKSELCELAAQFSDDEGNRGQCGQLGWVVPGMLEPTVEQAVFGLRPGELSSVVESEYGFHIFWRN